ncbi:response regulator [Chitinophagaceae bacterium LB-8]|uniref:Response regulator n=1 Tax=Paraflavisolibacter caeni TaxID=2982496 RepID=A0A9X3BHM0_9BACT|nr:response regulator [Paraflavisolibacter caeni]MCU7548873.1 response regulator [Paraflavisolibacter caeni]
MPNKNLLTNILLVEDDEDDCYLFKLAMAEISPHTIINCSQDSDQLLEMIGNVKPSLIFIDYHLPCIGGINCLEQIKDHPVYKDIPVIMWSTSWYQTNVAACYHMGAQLYMEKPCTKRSLVEQLKFVIQQNGLSTISTATPANDQYTITFS